MQKVKLTAMEIYHLPVEQMSTFEDEDEIPENVQVQSEQRRLPRNQSPKPKASLHGIELWYDKRTGQKKIRQYSK
jgi:hypothetical protein